MKFMTMVKSVEGAGFPPQELFDGIAALGEEAGKAGVMVDMGGLMPTAAGAEVSLRGGEIEVTDGPFAEGKEVIGGFAVYETKTKAEALEWVRKFLDLHRKYWPGFECVVEVRQFMEGPPPAP
jgi:hypothetical protein